jgi:hypothetical protein
MVEGVRAGGIRGSVPIARDGIKTTDGSFVVDGGAASSTQNARLFSVAGIGMESMLALQGIDEDPERDRKARKRGTEIIAALTNLQRAMLAEEDPAQALRVINELAIDDPLAGDPGLGAILRAIVLRARVEVARREQRGD